MASLKDWTMIKLRLDMAASQWRYNDPDSEKHKLSVEKLQHYLNVARENAEGMQKCGTPAEAWVKIGQDYDWDPGAREITLEFGVSFDEAKFRKHAAESAKRLEAALAQREEVLRVEEEPV